MFTKKLIVNSVALALSLPIALSATADTILFDFDQNGSFTAVDSLDWAPGNALAVNSVPLAPAGTFTTYIQAELTTVTGPGGAFAQPIGAAVPYEITYVIALNERIRTASDIDGDGIPDIVAFDHLGGTITVYWDNFTGGTVNADGLTGNSGLGYGDGTPILTGTIIPTALGAIFTLTKGSAENVIQALDQYNANNLPGITTVTGSGNATIDAGSLVYNPLWFDGIGAETIVKFLLQATLEDPFDSINPELLVAGNAPVYGANSINGIYGGTGRESFHFEADANSSFRTQGVPEPGTLALLGVGLSLIGAMRRKQKAG